MAVTLAFKVLKDKDEAEDAAQEAFIRAYHSLKKFNRKSRYSTWLFRIVYNTSISMLRKKKYDDSFEINKFESLHTHEENKLEEKDRQHFINEAVNALNEIDRSIITLFYLQEYNLEEIGKIISMSPNNIKVRLHRARKKLAENLNRILPKESLYL